MTSTLPAPVATTANLAAQTRPDFPLLAQTACLGQPLIYLDHAATSQKPRQVLEALQQDRKSTRLSSSHITRNA